LGGFTLNNVKGQSFVKNSLKKLIESGKIPHAFLFCGPSGVGKEFMAFEFAKMICRSELSPEISEKAAAGISNLNEPYVKYIMPLPRGKNEGDDSAPLDKLSAEEIKSVNEELSKKIINPYYKISIPKANTVKINSIRDIKKFISLNYDDLKYRFIIISNAELMNETSQNALLKSLEEPPEGVIFILVISNTAKIRETILSRCWRINFSPLQNSEVAGVLTEYFKIDDKIAAEVSGFSNGSVTEALNLIDHDFGFLLEKTILFLRYSLGKKYHSAVKELNMVNDIAGSQSIKLLIKMIIYWFNDFERLRGGEHEGFYFAAHSETFKRFYQRYPNIRTENLVYNLEYLSSLIEQNINLNIINANIIFELSCLVSE
jgi:DNA polymerase-3 subunit delta'